ncbi:MAG: flagellar export chaperone FliS [Phycisphaerae bacterium]|nr:flagellar export chaperone FliS [Phycisphaerae bacterium]
MENVSNEYLQNAVMTASPEQLHLMLYDGAIRFTRQAIEATRAKDWEKAFTAFTRTQRIILEMNAALNYNIDADLCKRTAGLYNFIYRKLVESSVQRDAAIAEEVLHLLEYQRETWVMLIDRLRQERSGETPAATPGQAVHTPPPRAPEGFSSEDGALYGSLSVQG